MDDSHSRKRSVNFAKLLTDEDTLVNFTRQRQRQKKKVVISDDVEVFKIVPGTTQVQLVSRPKPVEKVAPTIDDIISETRVTLDRYFKWSLRMKATNHTRMFLLNRIRESLQLYAGHVEKLMKFISRYEQIQSEWLSKYGDFLKSQDSTDPEGLNQCDARKLVKGVVDNVQDGEKLIVAERVLFNTIDINRRKKIFIEYEEPLTRHSGLLENLHDNQNHSAEMLFNLMAHLNFLKRDQTEPLIPDFKYAD